MFIIRNVFVARPGCATQLANRFKEVAAIMNVPGMRVMTDVAGDFNTVVMEHTTNTLDELETRMKEMAANPAFREKMAGYTDLFLTGRREIFRIA